ncbi:MAG: arsenate reductase ArsC [Candidatus Omnitrophota bacterium]
MIKKKKVLFVCIENSCRSQIAEGFAKYIGTDVLEAYSAGSKPSQEVDPGAIEVMREIGIDISGQKSKGFSELPINKFDYVITLGCEDICPFAPADKHIQWNIEDPKGKNIDFFRRVRDEIKNKVTSFIKEEA